jgi:hypothetical protein
MKTDLNPRAVIIDHTGSSALTPLQITFHGVSDDTTMICHMSHTPSA